MFKWISSNLYDEIFKFTEEHFKHFDEGFEHGKRTEVKNITDFDFEKHNDKKIPELRKQLGLCQN